MRTAVDCLARGKSMQSLRMVGCSPEAIAPASAMGLRAGNAAAARRPSPATTFSFEGSVEGIPYPSLSGAQQARFQADFSRELASINAWAREQQWLPSPPAELQIFVSDEYKISRSLVPASIGRAGRMEFPAWKAIVGEAALTHELTHVFYPNGNRFLAEGLAIYLQARIGGNPAFPNFGRPLHEVARELLREMVPEFTPGQPESLQKIHLVDLDTIATPSPLRLRVGRVLYDNTPVGQAHLYPIAGSFTQFLIETHGISAFRQLYERTPLIPLERNAGFPERWRDVYSLSLGDLELQWRSIVIGPLDPA
jgi:hypothetical protein